MAPARCLLAGVLLAGLLNGAAVAAPFALPEETGLSGLAASPLEYKAPIHNADDLFARNDRLLEALPETEWSIDALAAGFGGDPALAFAFVRDRIAFDAYAGELRGADGALGAQAGNAFDRALLLQRLLQAMKVNARLAFATLDNETARRVVARCIATRPARSAAALDASASADLTKAAMDRAGRDYARLRASLGTRLEDMTAEDDSSAALAAVSRHAWVQAEIDGQWVDFDPTFAEAQPGATLAAVEATADSMPAADRDTVDLSVEIETWRDGALTSETVLTHSFVASDDSAKQIFFSLGPDLAMGAAIGGSLEGTSAYRPQLMIDGEVEQGQQIALGGPSGDSAVGGAIGMLDTGDTAGAELVAIRLSMTINTPEGSKAPIVRTLIDRLTPQQRAAGATAADLAPWPHDGLAWVAGTMHQIIFSTGGTNPADLVVDRALAAGQSLGAQHAMPQDESFGAAIWPLAVADRTVPAAIDVAVMAGLNDRPDVRAFIAEPQITIVSTGTDGSGEAGRVNIETDLAYASVRLLSADGVAPVERAKRRLWLGTVSTALESIFVLGPFDGSDSATLTGASFENAPAVLSDGLSDQAPELMTQQAASGLLIAVSGSPASAKAWWTIDPRTGETRSILLPGLGGVKGGGGRANLPGDFNRRAGSYDMEAYLKREQARRAGRGGGRPKDTCRPASEETTLLGCVSVPASWELGMMVGAGVAIVAEVVALILAFTG